MFPESRSVSSSKSQPEEGNEEGEEVRNDDQERGRELVGVTLTPESGVDGTLRHDNLSCHFGNVVGHQLDLVVENSANTSGHFGGG